MSGVVKNYSSRDLWVVYSLGPEGRKVIYADILRPRRRTPYHEVGDEGRETFDADGIKSVLTNIPIIGQDGERNYYWWKIRDAVVRINDTPDGKLKITLLSSPASVSGTSGAVIRQLPIVGPVTPTDQFCMKGIVVGGRQIYTQAQFCYHVSENEFGPSSSINWRNRNWGLAI